MDFKQKYELWVQNVKDEELKEQLDLIASNEQEIMQRFLNDIAFGTAGLRGIIGAGSFYMNRYTVGKATQGFADYLNECYGGGSVAIAYDSRNKSEFFAKLTASVFAQNGIDVHIYSELMPTPMLSFAVRKLKATAGVMITASHNPAEYNGYKAYGSDGCQMTTEDADAVFNKIQNVDIFNDIKEGDFDTFVKQGKIKYIQKSVINDYYKEVLNCSVSHDAVQKAPIKMTYSPLNGAGNKPVRHMLSEIGIKDVAIVKEQELPDGNFTTCSYPNPETKEALKLGIELAQANKSDIMIATDPDGDRVGVAVRHQSEYRILSGNEMGILLLNYIITARTAAKTMPKNPIAVRSVVSSALADEVAKSGGVEMKIVLTGFKFIGEQILLLEQKGEQQRFILGFEESCGYLSGSYVRDKDAVLASMLLAEMTCFYKAKNKTLIDVLEGLYEKFGAYKHSVLNFAFSGACASDDMAKVMDKARNEYPDSLVGKKIVSVSDYLNGVQLDLETKEKTSIDLPSSDIVKYTLENGAEAMMRPSGTEPKMKIYLTAKEKTEQLSAELLDDISSELKEFFNL